MSGPRPSLNVGIFGGTFDPPHVGHLIVAQDAAHALGLDRVLFVPAAIPPHKQHAAITPGALRARMLELAIGDEARFAAATLELDRHGASYTVDTLRDLARLEPDTRWTLLMGADQFADFDTWREPGEIRRLARIAVMTRGGRTGPAADAGTGAGSTGTVRIEVTRIDISATEVRRRVAARQPIRYLVPRAVEEFIFEQGLYVRNGTTVTG